MKLLFQTFLCYNADYVGGDGEDEGTVYTRTFRYTLILKSPLKIFLIKLDMKPDIRPVEISIFLPNNVTVGTTKVMNRADKNWAHF